ncbi:hypothetical protein H6F88_12740 [Oculatella sp. FACHB-28]|nr:hypothetical protein [Oculatella sp. FACHB-28]
MRYSKRSHRTNKCDRPSSSFKQSAASYLDEIPLTPVCCHAKVVIFTHGNRTTLKDLAPLKAVATSNERLTPKLY